MKIKTIISEHKKIRPFFKLVKGEWVRYPSVKPAKGYKRVEAIMENNSTKHLDILI